MSVEKTLLVTMRVTVTELPKAEIDEMAKGLSGEEAEDFRESVAGLDAELGVGAARRFGRLIAAHISLSDTQDALFEGSDEIVKISDAKLVSADWVAGT